MCGRGQGKDNAEKKRFRQQEDGFEGWGGYMAAKRTKLLQQFHSGSVEKESDIFGGVKIMINGLTHPPENELKDLMAKHGGEWHMYQTSATTHIIASNLPNTKIKHLGAIPIVKPAWITESIALGKLLDYKRYLLYTNQSSKQPALNFPVIDKNIVTLTPNDVSDSSSQSVSQEKDFAEIDVDSLSIEVGHTASRLAKQNDLFSAIDKTSVCPLTFEVREFSSRKSDGPSLSQENKVSETCNNIAESLLINRDSDRLMHSSVTNNPNLSKIWKFTDFDKSNGIGKAVGSGRNNINSDEDLFKGDIDVENRDISKSVNFEQDCAKVRINTGNINQEKHAVMFDMEVTKTYNIESATSKPPSGLAQMKITKTASDPRFLEEFYNNSRLHLISTLGAEFKQLVGQLRDKSDGKFPGREKLKQEKGRTSVISPPQSAVMHIDMDCFFVSVGLRSHPELRGKPVAITHARSGTFTTSDPVKEAEKQANRIKEFEMYTERLPIGAPSRVVDIKEKIDGLESMSEIASCSYEARKCGIKNGMFMGQAVKLCPELKTLPYDFQGYKEVSNILYKMVASYTLDIEAVSCDEMYVDVRPILTETGLTIDEWANHIRKEIMEVTGCPCSTGFGSNRLQARLATRKAKPAGQYYLQPDDVEDFMSSIFLEDLPGVGRATLAKLKTLGLSTCGDVQGAPLKLLQSELGNKLGEKIKDQSFGRDNNPLNFHHERKSVSAEINYGIRFKTRDETYNFLQNLSKEVFSRLSDLNMKSRCLTLKLLVRAEGAPMETAKFLGHGVCDALSKSTTSNQILADANAIFREAKLLYDKLNAPFAELRGVGIQLTKLEKNAPVNKALSKFLMQGAVKKTDQIQHKEGKNQIQVGKNIDNVKSNKKDTITPFPRTKLTDFIPQAKANKSSNNIESTEIEFNKITHEKGVISVEKGKFLKNSTTTTDNEIIQPNLTHSINSTIIRSKGRGRAKGSKNGYSKTKNTKNTVKSVSKHVTMMQGFLGLKKKAEHFSQQEKKECLIEPVKQIDMHVFNQLPADIRAEIMREYTFKPLEIINQNIEKDNPSPQELNPEKVNIVVTAKKSVRTQEKSKLRAKEKNRKTSPFENLSWEEIKPIIKAWIKSVLEPDFADVEMLGKHFRKLAKERKIEVLKSIFNFMYRIFSDLDCPWHKAYFAFVNMMQTGMVEQYGLVLFVTIKFQCCYIH